MVRQMADERDAVPQQHRAPNEQIGRPGFTRANTSSTRVVIKTEADGDSLITRAASLTMRDRGASQEPHVNGEEGHLIPVASNTRFARALGLPRDVPGNRASEWSEQALEKISGSLDNLKATQRIYKIPPPQRILAFLYDTNKFQAMDYPCLHLFTEGRPLEKEKKDEVIEVIRWRYNTMQARLSGEYKAIVKGWKKNKKTYDFSPKRLMTVLGDRYSIKSANPRKRPEAMEKRLSRFCEANISWFPELWSMTSLCR